MTEKVAALLEALNRKDHRKFRKTVENLEYGDFFALENQVKCIRTLAELEEPYFLENDSFGFNRSVSRRVRRIFGNVTPNYSRILTRGFDDCIERLCNAMEKTEDPEKLDFGQAMMDSLNISLELVERHKAAAKAWGQTRLYAALEQVPRRGARSFYEACVCLKICIYLLRLNFTDHVTLGRFDQYMYPFYQMDKARGVSDGEIFELIEELFISLNRDSDLYPGIQVGDNGQSMVLGGFDGAGKSMYNELSQMCMQASLELKLIDPKINLRVGRNTPDAVYELAAHLTKAGLGFPQYCNDDVVVPGLQKLGYDREDALNYTVAACWEFIVPGVGADIPNIDVMDFPLVVNETVCRELPRCESFEALLEKVEADIAAACDRLVEQNKTKVLPRQAFLSLFFDGCIELLTSLWHGGTRYHNFGCHGVGLAVAADSLAAVKKLVFDEKSLSPWALLDALARNFEDCPEIRNRLLNCPKMGNNDDCADSLGVFLLDAYGRHLNGRPNGQHGIFRAGTGSAMYYVRKGETCPATADGRCAGEPYPSSLAPGLDVQTKGVLSVIQSFTKPDYRSTINGGPLTLELHDTVFRNDEGIRKTAWLVKAFVRLRGHQLQLNAINRDRLLDAREHPEKYPNLIVRVWGWSGYFNELDAKYQDHIIRRTEFAF